MKTLLLFIAAMQFIFSDINAKVIYVEPVQNAKYVSVKNNIIIGFDGTIISSNLNSSISVIGSISGVHTGEIILTAEGKKLIFKPHQPFAYNEQVKVNLNGLRTSNRPNNKLSYTFQTSLRKIENVRKNSLVEEMENAIGDNMVFPGNIDAPPVLTVNVSNNPSPGFLFLNAFGNIPTPQIFIANNAGAVLYSQEFSSLAVDFSRQPNGLLTFFSSEDSIYLGMDNQFNIVDSFYTGNGYSTDIHELRVLNNGHALLMIYDPQPVDMSQIVAGGDPNAIVEGLIIQEIDENKNVVFQWRSWDHFNIVDAIYENLTAPTVDYVHGNAIEHDNDGNILISSRHLSEITKINRSTGEIIWRMGGVNNEFTFINDTIPFHYQHHIRRIQNGNVTLFDNGNFRTPSFSRAVEYTLDEVNKTATLAWQYRNTPDTYGAFMGSVQRLRNGNTLIGWGGTSPMLTEVTPSGTKALEISLPPGVFSYRAYRDEVVLTLNVKMAIQGFFEPSTNMLSINDTVRAYVRNSTSPYGIVDSAKSVVDSTNFNGNYLFYNVPTGNYYISLKHRNGLETWSKAGGETFVAGEVYSYDFTSSDAQAYGNNETQKGSKYCIFSGDVNQDGHINILDIVDISNNANSFTTGYVSTDVNGDYISDLTDVVITNNNSVSFVQVIQP